MTNPADADGAMFRIAPPQPLSPPAKCRGFQVLSISQLMERRSTAWLIKKVIHRGELVVVYGDASAGKTFTILDLALRLVTGLDWWGKATHRGPVLYIAGEGVGGLRQRIAAWLIHQKVEAADLPLHLLPEAVMLLEDDQFHRLLQTLEALPEPPVLIVIDTFARCMAGGDENSAECVGKFIQRCGVMQQKTGVTVLLVHHKNKLSTAERGSSALRGAADVMIEVRRNGHLIELEGTKAKDTVQLETIFLESRSLMVGTDEDGEPETSLVLDLGSPPDQAPAAQPASTSRGTQTKLDEQRERILEALESVADSGPAPGADLFKAVGGARSTFYEALRQLTDDRLIDAVGHERRRRYLLAQPGSPTASPSPSPSIPLVRATDSDPDSDPEPGSGVQPGESESGGSALPRETVPDSDKGTGAGLRVTEVEQQSETPSEEVAGE